MKQSLPDKLVSLSWMMLWLMLPVSLRGSLLFLWIFGAAVLFRIVKSGIVKPDGKTVSVAFLFILFLIWNAISLLFDNNQTLWWKSLEKKAALLIVPLLLLFIDQQKLNLEKWAVRGFFTGLLITSTAMLFHAVQGLISGENSLMWTYHEIGSLFGLGAIYASWYFSSALIYLAYRKQEAFIEKLKPVLIFIFLGVLLLLASKLFITLTVPLLLWKLAKDRIKSPKKLLTITILLLLVFSVSSPFLLRMSELKNTNFKVLRYDSFSYDTPLNGLTFRLLQWRFASEILDENNAWLTGVGINSSQNILDRHYKLKGIYTGNPELGDSGYLGYNYHNQYLETLVATGIPGLILLLLIIFSVFYLLSDKLLFPLLVIFISTLFFFTESVLERQAGILFFCLIVFTFSDNLTRVNGNNSVKK